MKSILHMTTLLLAALWLSGAVARPAAAADEPARWTVQPAADRFGPGRQDFAYTLGAGGRIEDGVVVVNQGPATLQLALRGVGAWVRLERDVVTVGPGASITVPFTITPPKSAAAGDHAGGIVTFPVGSAAPAGAGPRHRLPVRLRVSGPLKPALAVDDVHIHYSDTANPLGAGDATVTYTIRNTGNVTLTARQAVSAAGPLGSWARRAGRIADSPALLPGATWKGSAPLRGVTPALRLKATVAVVPLLADAAGSIAPLPATTATGHALAVPWALLLVVIVVGGLVGVALRRARVRVPRRANGAVA